MKKKFCDLLEPRANQYSEEALQWNPIWRAFLQLHRCSDILLLNQSLAQFILATVNQLTLRLKCNISPGSCKYGFVQLWIELLQGILSLFHAGPFKIEWYIDRSNMVVLELSHRTINQTTSTFLLICPQTNYTPIYSNPLIYLSNVSQLSYTSAASYSYECMNQLYDQRERFTRLVCERSQDTVTRCTHPTHGQEMERLLNQFLIRDICNICLCYAKFKSAI